MKPDPAKLGECGDGESIQEEDDPQLD